jgi:predicted DNA-binding protein (MmcQ/YjbR family)
MKESHSYRQHQFTVRKVQWHPNAENLQIISIDDDRNLVVFDFILNKAIELREEYSSITPGYHMNKKMWNTITIDGSLPLTKIYELINHSYLEVVKGMSKKLKDQLV